MNDLIKNKVVEKVKSVAIFWAIALFALILLMRISPAFGVFMLFVSLVWAGYWSFSFLNEVQKSEKNLEQTEEQVEK